MNASNTQFFPVPLPESLSACEDDVQKYVDSRIQQFANAIIQRFGGHPIGDEVQHAVMEESERMKHLNSAQGTPLAAASSRPRGPAQIKPVLRHACRSSACGDPQCALCESNLLRPCSARNLRKKYLVNMPLKAKCNAPIYVDLVNEAGELQAGTSGVSIKLQLLSHEKFEEKTKNWPVAPTLQDLSSCCAAVEKGLLWGRPQNNRHATADGAPFVIIPVENGRVGLVDVSVVAKNRGQENFRLLAVAIDNNGQPLHNRAFCMSAPFQVRADRSKNQENLSKGDIVSDILLTNAAIGKLVNMGEQRVLRMACFQQHLEEAAKKLNVNISLVPEELYSITTVGQVRQLVQICKQDEALKRAVTSALNLKNGHWDELVQHVMQAVPPDFRPRIWKDLESGYGIIFCCHNGAVKLDQPDGLLRLADSYVFSRDDISHDSSLLVVQQHLQTCAEAAWKLPKHPGWSIYRAPSTPSTSLAHNSNAHNSNAFTSANSAPLPPSFTVTPELPLTHPSAPLPSRFNLSPEPPLPPRAYPSHSSQSHPAHPSHSSHRSSLNLERPSHDPPLPHSNPPSRHTYPSSPRHSYPSNTTDTATATSMQIDSLADLALHLGHSALPQHSLSAAAAALLESDARLLESDAGLAALLAAEAAYTQSMPPLRAPKHSQNSFKIPYMDIFPRQDASSRHQHQDPDQISRPDLADDLLDYRDPQYDALNTIPGNLSTHSAHPDPRFNPIRNPDPDAYRLTTAITAPPTLETVQRLMSPPALRLDRGGRNPMPHPSVGFESPFLSRPTVPQTQTHPHGSGQGGGFSQRSLTRSTSATDRYDPEFDQARRRHTQPHTTVHSAGPSLPSPHLSVGALQSYLAQRSTTDRSTTPSQSTLDSQDVRAAQHMRNSSRNTSPRQAMSRTHSPSGPRLAMSRAHSPSSASHMSMPRSHSPSVPHLGAAAVQSVGGAVGRDDVSGGEPGVGTTTRPGIIRTESGGAKRTTPPQHTLKQTYSFDRAQQMHKQFNTSMNGRQAGGGRGDGGGEQEAQVGAGEQSQGLASEGLSTFPRGTAAPSMFQDSGPHRSNRDGPGDTESLLESLSLDDDTRTQILIALSSAIPYNSPRQAEPQNTQYTPPHDYSPDLTSHPLCNSPPEFPASPNGLQDRRSKDLLPNTHATMASSQDSHATDRHVPPRDTAPSPFRYPSTSEPQPSSGYSQGRQLTPPCVPKPSTLPPVPPSEPVRRPGSGTVAPPFHSPFDPPPGGISFNASSQSSIIAPPRPHAALQASDTPVRGALDRSTEAQHPVHPPGTLLADTVSGMNSLGSFDLNPLLSGMLTDAQADAFMSTL